MLAAVLILLAGAFVWGILGRLETTVPAVVISRDGAAVCCYDTAYGAEVGAGMPVRVGGEELSLVSVSSEPLSSAPTPRRRALTPGSMSTSRS